MKRTVALIVLLLIGAAEPTLARSQTECWFADGHLYATGLPTTYPFAVTQDPYPIGTTQTTEDGTFVAQWTSSTAYFWVRGHGSSLIKAGPQLNDYHVICIAP